MKRVCLVLIFIVTILSLSAQRASRTSRSTYYRQDQAIRVKIIGGYVLPLSTYGSIPHSLTMGGELSYEFFTNNKNDWAVHWRKPVIGVALQGLNLGNASELGQMIALFPYVRWDLVRSKYFIYSLRIGAGLAGVTKLNNANSSYIGFVGNGSMEFQINLNDEDWITFDPGLEIFSNGGLASTEFPMVIPYISLGYLHRFDSYQYITTNESMRPYTKPLPYKFMANIGVEAGGMDDWKSVKADLHADFLWKATNCWATGIGLDGSYGKRLHGDTLDVNKRLSAGLSWSNRLTMHRFHFIMDWGIYLYDPKCPGKYFYSYNPIHGHSWNYFRIGAALRVYDNFFIQLNVHTNGFRAEYTTFGLSYSIQERKKRIM